MFCIAAFIVFAILGIFSARYRDLAKKAWVCVAKRVTFRPCDISFSEELKTRMVGRLIFTRPRLAKFIEKWIDVFSFVFVVLTIWSLGVVLISGLNYFVYDTCNPRNAESCSLGGEACGIGTGDTTFFASLKTGQVVKWFSDETKTLGRTITMVPNRIKKWNPQDFVTDKSTYYEPFDSFKPLALEIVDPGCVYCSKLFEKIKKAGFEKTHNLTYIPYPIPDPKGPGGYKFTNSRLISKYLLVLREYKPEKPSSSTPADWRLLEKMFTGFDTDGVSWRDKFNLIYNEEQARSKIKDFLIEFGFSCTEATDVRTLTMRDEAELELNNLIKVVEQDIRTVKIPTIMFDGHRYDRVIDENKLK
jgi:hypothetical protein